jgi:hypothetical protein
MNTGIFPPAKRLGLLFHGFVVAALAGLSAWGFWRLSATPVGPAFVLTCLSPYGLAPIPLLGYRAYVAPALCMTASPDCAGGAMRSFLADINRFDLS